ncbi:hypothetical protein H1V43_22270 [Streptomyces sp. PSKA54]|uniref:Uncharacterized protein n=1 Tax=Streptomyces himalayensis subsp. aureolus TaxID=2758039 RepID=A0A7W2D3F1_9ACTN|nr:hypothetical protein [Streptomyces himalayensis]MBA4864033.1 hypothetical protein [Streptomyces himalayensis subsp. aureolus]
MNGFWDAPAAERIAALREQAEQYDEPSADRRSRPCPLAHASEWSADRSHYGWRRFAQSAAEVRRGRAKGSSPEEAARVRAAAPAHCVPVVLPQHPQRNRRPSHPTAPDGVAEPILDLEVPMIRNLSTCPLSAPEGQA